MTGPSMKGANRALLLAVILLLFFSFWQASPRKGYNIVDSQYANRKEMSTLRVNIERKSTEQTKPESLDGKLADTGELNVGGIDNEERNIKNLLWNEVNTPHVNSKKLIEENISSEKLNTELLNTEKNMTKKEEVQIGGKCLQRNEFFYGNDV